MYRCPPIGGETFFNQLKPADFGVPKFRRDVPALFQPPRLCQSNNMRLRYGP